jgi:hypothetical protein
MSPRRPGTLKCVVAASGRRHLCDLVEDALAQVAHPDDVLRLSDDALLVYTDLEPAAIRDSLTPVLQDGETAFIAEFERWSTLGPIDRQWLVSRGH